jgi:hypothetical protein
VRVIPLNCETDGNFYRDPEPTPDNLKDLMEAVKKSSADLGFATDRTRTGSRCDGHPRMRAISEEYTLALRDRRSDDPPAG